jgi:uncharacterized protein (TIGR02246 family)
MTSNNTTSVLAGPDSAIRAVFDEVSSAWGDGDADAFTGWYADGATVILPGFYLPDKDAIRASMAAAFAGPLKGSRRIHQVQNIRHLGAGTAIVISDSATVFPGEAEPAAERRERATWVLSKRDGRWLIEAYHSCPENAA